MNAKIIYLETTDRIERAFSPTIFVDFTNAKTAEKSKKKSNPNGHVSYASNFSK